MSGRKNKHKQRGHQQRGPSTDLLDELSTLRDLLGSDDIGDIPLLDRVAEPGKPRPAVQEPLDEIDLPTLFSPMDEELPDDQRAELDESDRELLRPLQDLPLAGREPSAQYGEPSAQYREPSAQHEEPSVLREELPAPQEEPPTPQEKPSAQPPAHPKETDGAPGQEQQGELFSQPAAGPVKENPFLPAHIRARLTGGRVPKVEEQQRQAQQIGEPPPPEASPEAAQPAKTGELATQAAPPDNRREAAAGPEPEGSDARLSEPEMLRRQLVDRLVAKQLPELERQLRARIERMLDELEAKH